MTEPRHDVSSPSDDDALIAAAKRELDGSCRALDGRTLSRLNSIRHAALERKTMSRQRALLPFGGLVTACVLVLALGLDMPVRSPEVDVQTSNSPIEDIELLSSDESLDLLEDYEFYQWLADNGSSI